MDNDLKVLIVDDHQVIVDLMASLIADDLGAHVLQAKNLDQAIEVLQNHQDTNLALVDYGMPGVSGIESIKSLVTSFPNVAIVLFTGNESKSLIASALSVGAKGVVLKSEAAASISEIIKFILTGHTYTPPEIYNESQGNELQFDLTEREYEMLECLRSGMTNRAIAEQKNLSDSTVKLHIRTLFGKIGAKNRTQAVMIAEQLGL